MLPSPTYERRRGEIAHYFDRTAATAWARLTSDAPVSRIRATVRAGRERMAATLLDWLPSNLHGLRILDAGCGTGTLAAAMAQRGAHVVAIDLSPQLVALARERHGHVQGRLMFSDGDMSDVGLGSFDHVVAMDSLIHYQLPEVLAVLRGWAPRVRGSMVVTIAPATPALRAMHALGRLFPRSDRAPSIAPVSEARLRAAVADDIGLANWELGRLHRVSSGFYTSQATELRRLA